MVERTYYSARDRSANTYELQMFLRYIARFAEGIEKVEPDGVYGPETKKAVADFQRKAGIPVSGIADFETWTKIVESYDDLQKKHRFPHEIAAYPPEIPHLKEGDDFEEIYFLQIMLRRIAKIYKNIESPDLTGVYDPKTSRAVDDFARIYGKESGGKVDRELWNILTDTFNAFTING